MFNIQKENQLHGKYTYKQRPLKVYHKSCGLNEVVGPVGINHYMKVTQIYFRHSCTGQ